MITRVCEVDVDRDDNTYMITFFNGTRRTRVIRDNDVDV